ncbi:Benzoate 4-monooxygenase cytochrome p450 [Pyrenophora seminiperda CCB06]|uniref:Benzoate 4-monooxygenase cytochrome p450 n=1 Tax=Pyrenophora seminiperda CCB06 TaxID=1302712 RepID=A0A3M7MG67_9PLEO|nr:Benzoate 4-monooxygenase cytochrome p450 [Pyrenophora seminiperda CCB06]
MDQHQMIGWQLPPGDQDTVDSNWFSEFLAIDNTFSSPDTIGNLNDIHGSANNTNCQGFTSGDTAALNQASSLPIYSSDTILGPLKGHERPVAQRQHTLPRRRSKYLIRRTTGFSSPIVISSGSFHNDQGQSPALQRWRNSPPEDEAASLSAIYHALEDQPMRVSPRISRPSSGDAFRNYRDHGPSSTTSLDSAVSESSLRSGNSSHSARSQTKRRSQPSKTRNKGKAKPRNMRDPERIFKCTFCCDTFKHKYDWTRHEKSLHLNMEEWMCTPHGASVVLPSTGRVHCAYCSALDPTPEHLQAHNHSVCAAGQSTPRVFRRKDHLVQHLRLVHAIETLPFIDDWKVKPPPVTSRCGICSTTLQTWDERADHLAAHFRAGKTMEDWKGELGFEPAVAARVINAFPPYLLAEQAMTVEPFSATNPVSIDHTKQMISNIQLEEEPTSSSSPASNGNGNLVSTPQDEQDLQDSLESLRTLSTQHDYDFSAILTRHLARFARRQMLAGIIPTDEMFQRESRRLLYQDDSDEWNQTIVDNPKWLREFRKNSGLDEELGDEK